MYEKLTLTNMSVLQLASQNFQVVGRQKKALSINMPGIILVFFKMDGCDGCASFEPIFYQLATQEQRITYGIANLSTSRDIISSSRSTTTPIQTVPYVVLYVNGSPYAKYNGKKTLMAMKSFVSKIMPQIPSPNSNQSFVAAPQSLHPSQGGIYGSGGYQHPQLAPQMVPHQGHAGFAPQRGPQNMSGEKVWMPDLADAPSMSGVRGDGSSRYAHLNDIEEEDEEKLELPGQVTPHNVPWESEYKKFGTMD